MPDTLQYAGDVVVSKELFTYLFVHAIIYSFSFHCSGVENN